MVPGDDGRAYWVVTFDSFSPRDLNNYSSKILFDIGFRFPQKHSACPICNLGARLSQPGGQALPSHTLLRL